MRGLDRREGGRRKRGCLMGMAVSGVGSCRRHGHAWGRDPTGPCVDNDQAKVSEDRSKCVDQIGYGILIKASTSISAKCCLEPGTGWSRFSAKNLGIDR